MTEIWEEYEGYQVSNYGRILGKRLGRPLKTFYNKGMEIVRLYIGEDKKGTLRSVAHLVAELFVPLPEAGCKLVEHIDGDHRNNRADNLRWHVKRKK